MMRQASRRCEIRISYTPIESPITGVVSEVTAQEGETIVAGLQVANLITVLDPARLEMWVYVDETDVGQVHAGQAAEFRVDAYPGKTFDGAQSRPSTPSRRSATTSSTTRRWSPSAPRRRSSCGRR